MARNGVPFGAHPGHSAGVKRSVALAELSATQAAGGYSENEWRFATYAAA